MSLVKQETLKRVYSHEIELYRNLIFLPVHVNGSRPLKFVLDTGATESCLNAAIAKKLGVEVNSEEIEGKGAGEAAIRAQTAANVTFQLGEVRMVAKTARVIPMSDLESRVGHHIDGVLGAEFLNSFTAEIDYKARWLRLYQSEAYRYAGRGQIIPIILDGIPFIRATVHIAGNKLYQGLFAIDTGWIGALVLSSNFVQQNRLLESDRAFLSRSAYGLGGETVQIMQRIERLKIGGFVLSRPVAELSVAKAGALVDAVQTGIIGNEILQRFRLVLDYRRSRIILEPNSFLGHPFETDMSGLLLVSEGEDLKQVKIQNVFTDSPAAKANLKSNDLILSIDNKSIERYTLETITKMFEKHDKICRLRIKRGQQVFQIQLVMKRLI